MADALTLLVWKAYAVAVASERSRLDSCVWMRGAMTGVVRSLFAMTFFVRKTRCVQMADALTLLVPKAYAVAVASERSRLDSCVQKENALTILVRKAYAVAAASERSRLASYVRTHGAVANCV